MKKPVCNLVVILLLSCYPLSKGEVSFLDQFTPVWRVVKDLLSVVLKPTTIDNSRRQTVIKDDVPFPCSLENARSSEPPTSVHRLRPGDIDVIGALGDSLTAGNALFANNVLQVVLENRGVTFPIGGQGTWREFVTLPNILKVFNPNLFGYSLKDGFGHHKSTQYNLAEGGAISINTPYMSKVLVKRMQADSRIDIKKHWKMITFMIGANDHCGDLCYKKDINSAIEEHRDHLLRVLRTIRDNLPRTIVNIILQPDVSTLGNTTSANKPPICYFVRNLACPCMFGLQFESYQKIYQEVLLKWRQVEIEVCNEPEFDREDFAVVLLPFTQDYSFHTTADGLTDYSAIAVDCFHFSPKEGSRAALSLWNNLLEPVGRKTTYPFELLNMKCPTSDYPYIYTKRNS